MCQGKRQCFMNFLAVHIFQESLRLPSDLPPPSSHSSWRGWGGGEGPILCNVCCTVNVVVWGQWIYKQARCQNQFCISPGGSVHYHNTSSANWGCEFIIRTKIRAGWVLSLVDIQMFYSKSKFFLAYVYRTGGFALFNEQKGYFFFFTKALSTIDYGVDLHSILKSSIHLDIELTVTFPAISPCSAP